MYLSLTRLSACCCLALLALLPMRASTISPGSYALNNAYENGDALQGTVTLDSNGLVTSAAITYNSSMAGQLSFSSVGSKGSIGGDSAPDFAYIAGSNGQLALFYSSVLNSAGGLDLCISGASCTADAASYVQVYSANFTGDLTSGSLASSNSMQASKSSRTAVVTGGPISAPVEPSIAVTAEPSSFILLVTGIVITAVVGTMRRRRHASLPIQRANL